MTSEIAAGTTLTVDGGSYVIELPHHERDYIQGRIMSTRQPYEWAMLQDIDSRIDENAVVLDVGANIGNHALYLAAITGCRVHAFEPHPELAAALVRSADTNGLADRLIVHQVAVGRRNGRGHFTVETPDNLGAQSVTLDTKNEGSFDIIALDGVVRGRVDVMKIDVEGMELDVLRGAQRLISEHRPLLYVECRDLAAFDEIAGWAANHGYQFADRFNVTPTFLLHPDEVVAKASDRALVQTIRDQYALTQLANDAKARLDAANLKYREVSQQAKDAISKLGAADAKCHEATKQARDAQTQLDAANLRYRATNEGYARMREQLAEVVAERDTVTKALQIAQVDASAKVRALTATVDTLTHEQRRLADALTRARQTAQDHKAAAEAADRAAAQARRTVETVRASLIQAERLATAQRDAADRSAELVAELRARAVAVELALNDAVRSAEDSRDRLRRHEVETNALVRDLHAQAAELRQQNAEAAALSDDLRTENADLAAANEKLRQHEIRAGARVRDLRAENERLKASLADATTDARTNRDRLAALRGSRAVRVARAIAQARHSPRVAALLPLTLFRILLRHTAQPQTGTTGPRAPRAAVHSNADPSPARTPLVEAASVPPMLADVAVAERLRTRRLRVAAIMDEFTHLSFEPECELHQLTPKNWRTELAHAHPDMLFVESAWRGVDNTWTNTVHLFDEHLRGIVDWCHERAVPTVFWNKEDPAHYTTFLTTASHFDYVFTTDMDCVPLYKEALGHDRVGLLPFAAQPRLHHPIETNERRDAFMFAGAYYRRYPERTKDLESFARHLSTLYPVEIFDRNLGTTDENYRFPDEYQSMIVGTLPANGVADAYRGYRWAVNLNSVKQSQSMFARRVFELLATNTLIVSNYARSISLFFGDLVIVTDSGNEALKQICDLEASRDVADRVRLAGLRRVMSQHTYGDRLRHVAEVVLGLPAMDTTPTVTVVTVAETAEQVRTIASMLTAQTNPVREWRVFADVATADESLVTAAREHGAILLDAALLRGGSTWAEIAPESDLIAVMTPADHYGPNYLTDLALATRYSGADIIGKAARFVASADNVTLEPGEEYRHASRLPVRSSVVGRERAKVTRAELLLDPTSWHESADCLAIDRFNYCQDGANCSDMNAVVDDLTLDLGIAFADLQHKADAATRDKQSNGTRALDTDTLACLVGTNGALTVTATPEGLRVESTLPDGQHQYVWGRGLLDIADLWTDRVAAFHVTATAGLSLQVALAFHGAEGKLRSDVVAVNRNQTLDIPAGATHVKLALRALGSGAATVQAFHLQHIDTEPVVLVPRGKHLVLTNHYPTYDDLYRNAFVHSRVRGYRQRGTDVDVFRLRTETQLSFHEFKGTEVITGSNEALRRLLAAGQYESVMVHFLDENMWNVLASAPAHTRILVWMHGAEVAPWWRRAFNFATDAELSAAKTASDERVGFWRRFVEANDPRVHFVFVSRWYAQAVMDDLGVVLDESRYSIIHNPIDTDLFAYRPKDADARFEVLCVRPFASRKYANDLAVEAILKLRNRPWFEQMTFDIFGDGPLFDETVAPVRGLPNVHLTRGFLTQSQIAEQHAQHGIFLVPSRDDTQGVSRDEAMASGLVPVTSAVTAIPEFVDHDCAILAPMDDADELAAGIARLVEQPEEFLRMSKAAAARVRSQSDAADILTAELNLIRGVR